jgi:hypothetical protein
MQISDYIVKSKNCSIINGSIVLDSGKSLLGLSFNNKGSVYSLEISRDKGADINILIDGVPYKVNPSKPKLIDVSAQAVVLSRPIKSNGKLIISKILCDGVDITTIKESNNVIVLQDSWNDFLCSVGRISGIKKTEVGVLASEYAEIKNSENIIDIKTHPPSSWIRKNGSIVFTYPCRIFEIELSTDIKKSNKKEYVNNIISNTPVKQQEIPIKNVNKVNSNNIKPILAPVKKENKNKSLETIIFDTNEEGILNFISESSGIQQIEGVINFSVLGKVSLSLPKLQPNADYFFFVRTNSINGNGKIGIQLIDELRQSYGVKIFSSSSNKTDLIVKIRTSNFDSNYQLVLYRPLKISTGVVSVSRVVIKTNFSGNSSSGVVPSINSIANNSNILNKTIISANISKITNSINFSTEGSELWFNRLLKNHTLTKQISDISFCSLDDKPIHPRVFIEEFNTENLNTNNFIKFMDSSEIITPSLSNYILLKNIFQNKRITISGRLIPLSKNISEFNSEDKVVLFNKNEKYTKSIIENWDKSFGELIVIGGNVSNENVTLINDVLSLEDLFSIITKSYLVLDIGECSHYISSIIEIARYLNKPVLTNNVRYIIYDSISFINNENDIESITNSIKNIYSNKRLSFSQGDKTIYNESFNTSIQRIMYG